MPRQVQFEDDDETTSQRNEGPQGREVDIEEAEKEDGELPFDDLAPRGMLRVDDEEEETDEQDEDEEQEEEPASKRRARSDDDEDEDGPSWRNRLLKTEKLIEDLSDTVERVQEENSVLKRTINKRTAEAKLATTKADADAKLAKLRTELAAAMEAGNTAETIRLQEEMADIKAEVKTAEQAVKDAPADEAPTEGADKSQPRKAREWIKGHPRFNRDPVFKATVSAIDKQIAAEGFDMNSDEYYDELDKRVKKRFPEEYKGEKNDKRELPPRRRHPAGGGERDESQGGSKRRSRDGFERTRGGKVMLTGKQLQNMARFGLDPDNEEDRRAYVRNNMSSSR